MASENYEEQSITVVPINGPAADVLNLDFDKLPPHQVKALREAWMIHGVLRFRGYEIPKEQHLAITKLFGDFVERDAQENGSAAAYKKPEEILVMSHTQAAPSGTKSNAELHWHSDSWFFEYPPVNEILHAIEVPKAGGDTYWVDMYAVYDALPPATRKTIDGRLIQFDTVYNGHGNLRKGQETPKTDDFRLWPHTRHPIVRTHPESGRNAIFIGYSDFKRNWIVGLPVEQSNAVLAEIYSHILRPEFQLHQVWHPGDMIVWDNRVTMHRRDKWSDADTRIMHRTTCNTVGQPRPFYVC